MRKDLSISLDASRIDPGHNRSGIPSVTLKAVEHDDGGSSNCITMQVT